jgi:hypothetical protein
MPGTDSAAACAAAGDAYDGQISVATADMILALP